jgi:DNA invertase Pin-like site-specific DNA recombinase
LRLIGVLFIPPEASRRLLASGAIELGPDADPFMLHLYAALAEKERRLISERTKTAVPTGNQIRTY